MSGRRRTRSVYHHVLDSVTSASSSAINADPQDVHASIFSLQAPRTSDRVHAPSYVALTTRALLVHPHTTASVYSSNARKHDDQGKLRMCFA